MMQHEFESLIGKKISADDYAIIEKVYMYHPVIKDNGGKEQIAGIYKFGGMITIRAMLQVATVAQDIEDEAMHLQKMIGVLRRRKVELAEGNVEMENCFKEMQELYGTYSYDDEKLWAEELPKLKKKYGDDTVLALKPYFE